MSKIDGYILLHSFQNILNPMKSLPVITHFFSFIHILVLPSNVCV